MTMNVCENVLTLDLFMDHQGKVVSLQNAGQLSQIISQADLKRMTIRQ